MTKNRKKLNILLILSIIIMFFSVSVFSWKITAITPWKNISSDFGAQGETNYFFSKALIIDNPIISYILIIGIIILIVGNFLKKQKWLVKKFSDGKMIGL